MAEAFAQRLLDAFVEAGLDRQQCEFDEAAGQMVINNEITRVVPIASLFAQYSLCADEAAREQLVDGAMRAFVEGAADVPSKVEETRDRLLPQLWNKQKIAARQMTLPPGFELPHCGLRGELPLDGELGVVLVCDYAADGLSIETPVLSRDLSRWGLSFTAALGKALENLRARTKKGPPAERWEHHPTGCGESCWKDRFDAVRIAVFPKLVATRKRPDGVSEQGGHVVAFATTSCVLASMSKNALGLCFMGDTLNLQISVRDPKQLLTSIPMRLMKMKDPQRDSAERHPLESAASEGMVWRWMPYSPGGPPLHSPGEFSVPVDQGEVDAILDAAEHGRAVPVFTSEKKAAASAVASPMFLKMKELGNTLFKQGDFMKAVSAYNAALKEDAVPHGDAAVAHSNAAQALLKMAEADVTARKALAAEALKRANEAVGLDPTNIKAYARCAAACELLDEHEAAAEFRQHQARCQAAAEATREARRAEVEQRQQQQEEQRKKMAAAMQEKARCEALLERERELERRRAKEEDGDLGQAEATRLSSMLGMDSSLAGLPRGVGGN